MKPDRSKLLDRRVARRHISSGKMEKSELEAHIQSLPDDEENAEWVCYDMEETEIAPTSIEEEATPNSEETP